MGTALIRSSLALGRFHTSVLAVPSCCLPSLLWGVQHPVGPAPLPQGMGTVLDVGTGRSPMSGTGTSTWIAWGSCKGQRGGQEGTAQCAQWCLCAFLRDDSILPHGC